MSSKTSHWQVAILSLIIPYLLCSDVCSQYCNQSRSNQVMLPEYVLDTYSDYHNQYKQ